MVEARGAGTGWRVVLAGRGEKKPRGPWDGRDPRGFVFDSRGVGGGRWSVGGGRGVERGEKTPGVLRWMMFPGLWRVDRTAEVFVTVRDGGTGHLTRGRTPYLARALS